MKKHNAIIIPIIIMNLALAIVAFKARSMLQQEIYEKNVIHGVSKCAAVVNNLDNIIYRNSSYASANFMKNGVILAYNLNHVIDFKR